MLCSDDAVRGMAKEDNLKSYKKGESGNPKGKVKGTLNRATVLKRFLSLAANYENPADESGNEVTGTLEEKLWAAQITRALTGDTVAFREIMDSMYGKIPQKSEIDHTSDGEKLSPTQIVFTKGNGGKNK